MHELLDQLYYGLKTAHVAFGFTALLLFWIPIVVKKGSKVHNRVGWAYIGAMSGVAVTAIYLAIWRLTLDPERTADTVAFAWFLMDIAILSGVTAFFGITVLRARRVKRGASVLEWGASSLLFVSGIVMSVYGFVIGNPLLSWFPLFTGAQLGALQLHYWWKQTMRVNESIIAHINGLLACSISTITAFTVFGAPRLLGIEGQSILLWLSPTIVITPLIFYFTKKYKR